MKPKLCWCGQFKATTHACGSDIKAYQTKTTYIKEFRYVKQSADSSGSHKLPKGGWSRPVSAPKSQARTRPGGQPSPSEHSYE